MATTADGICRIKSEYVVQCPEQKTNAEKRSLDVSVDNDKRKKKRQRGQNKARGPTFVRDKTSELCNSLILYPTVTSTCNLTQCVFRHDITAYLQDKQPDLGDKCYNFETFGRCPRGLMCRFGTSHIANGCNVIRDDSSPLQQTYNHLSRDVQHALRKRTYDFAKAKSVINAQNTSDEVKGVLTDLDVVKLTSREKPLRLNWRDKLILSPLTTVGNLPFRRICKEFGAEVTCGEMALCQSLVQGATQEWALLKRHHTEDLFGVQICGSSPHLLGKCAQLIEDNCTVDFVDLNLGCPIDLVYKSGAGCGLLRRPRILEVCIRDLNSILTVPLTIKTRTGVYANEPLAHKLVPKFREWGASLVTIHGRSREQRYTKNADWDYIREVARASQPLPIVGNGDILSYDEYRAIRMASPDLEALMIGRGALIKPWIFQEIQDQRGDGGWDISSGERFDILKRYVNYSLEHWGSDFKGVENTRRFLLEWLSFLYRYVPVGLLEVVPQRINQRPLAYCGRNDLETVMASGHVSDWIKISEMLLGPVPDGFKFLPKHKANSY